MNRNRAFFARSFCSGNGIEIGALHHPLPLPENAKARYVDRMTSAELRKHYPELADQPLVDVDIVDNGETLATLPDGQEDFVIANQFIEHCQNPVRALVNMLRVVRNDGIVMLSVPDKRFTFDKDRPITSNDHILWECLNGTESTKRAHFAEFLGLDRHPERKVELEMELESMLAKDYSIHYHVWDSDAFIKFLLWTKERFGLPFELQATYRNGEESIQILRKTYPVNAASQVLKVI
ncbi:MAG: methyltransferase domain-containing protein [Fibrobacteria bacterium]